MIQGLAGNLSAGKTMSLAYLGWLLQSEYGAKVYSNFWVGYPHTRIRSYDDFLNMRNGVLLADELWSWLDSYKSMDKAAQLIVRILLEAGKNGMDIIYTTQDLRQIHPRLRRITDEFVLPILAKARDKKGRLILLNGRSFPATCTLWFADFFLQPRYSLSFKCAPVFALYDTKEKIAPLEGLDRFKAVKALKEYRAMRKVEELGIDLKDA